MMSSTQRLQAIQARLQTLKPTSLQVEDESYQHIGHTGHGGAGHFAITIVAECFKGKSLLAKHRLVYDTLSDLMGSEIHALRIQAREHTE